MAKRADVSAGLLLFRRSRGGLELFLAHPGGPFWRNRDEGAWTIPKGVLDEGEDPFDAARREFEEETGIRPEGDFLPLGSIRQKAGKVVHAWAWEGDADPERVMSISMSVEWPRGSGRRITFPEVDRCAWLDPAEARRLINPAQAELIGRLEAALAEAGHVSCETRPGEPEPIIRRAEGQVSERDERAGGSGKGERDPGSPGLVDRQDSPEKRHGDALRDGSGSRHGAGGREEAPGGGEEPGTGRAGGGGA